MHRSSDCCQTKEVGSNLNSRKMFVRLSYLYMKATKSGNLGRSVGHRVSSEEVSHDENLVMT